MAGFNLLLSQSVDVTKGRTTSAEVKGVRGERAKQKPPATNWLAALKSVSSCHPLLPINDKLGTPATASVFVK